MKRFCFLAGVCILSPVLLAVVACNQGKHASGLKGSDSDASTANPVERATVTELVEYWANPLRDTMKWQGKLVGVDINKVIRDAQKSCDGLMARSNYTRDLFNTCCPGPWTPGGK